VRFSAGLDLDNNGDLVQIGGAKHAPKYVGEPSEEIDLNWEYLIRKLGNLPKR
jgi:hypothetical protein